MSFGQILFICRLLIVKTKTFIHGALLMFWHWTESPNTILSLNHVEDFITRKDSYWRTRMYWDEISTLNATVKFSHILKSLPIQICFLMATFWMSCLFKPAFQCCVLPFLVECHCSKLNSPILPVLNSELPANIGICLWELKINHNGDLTAKLYLHLNVIQCIHAAKELKI